MSKLYKIKVTHYAPRDSHTSIQEFVVANNDKEVFEYLAKGYAYWEDILDCWNGEPDEEMLEEYNDIYENKGDYREVYDLYYGATQYSWEEVELTDGSIIELMVTNGIAKKVVK